ncbi:MAG: 2-C-methyl-D-erythritol 2,4-cyclodiphosphate synthase, partial [Spirochaetales bacterium]|nr:2-C-methyl-D-erythritol 2,4-cyclodiphosphate synthase [Spirochaetales bacterium]
MIRVGTGYDIHRLEAGRDLILGGITISSEKGAVGHSDADALIHAIIDALLGAAALGDIGEHFPPSNPDYKGISSRKLLKQTIFLLQDAGWEPCNLDCTIVLDSPKLTSYKSAIRKI